MFIGKNIKQEHEQWLREDFLALKAEDPLRFKPGDKVLANARGGWVPAKVLRVWDEGQPYRLEMQDRAKTNIWAPMDVDFVVKAAP